VLLSQPAEPEAVTKAVLEELGRTWPVPPVATDLDRVELILREDDDGAKYLFAINLDPHAAREGAVVLRGRFGRVRELTVEGRPPVPTTWADGATTLPLNLQPGEGLFFAVGRGQ
jgi:hypothetical protein